MNKDNLNKVLLFQIDQTSRAAKQYSQREMDEKGMDVTVDQWVLLKIVEEMEQASQKEIADRALRDPASITRTLDLLEKKELLIREAVPGNRRSYSVKLTQKGRKFIKKYMPMVEAHRSNSTKGLSAKEIKLMIELLQRMRSNF